MYTSRKYFILNILFLMFSVVVSAQLPKPSFTLNTNESGNTRNYQAANFISLKSGFAYRATSGVSFRAWINPNLPVTIISITNPKPGDITGTPNDGTYTPGGSFSTDPLTGIDGLISNDFTATGSSGTSSPYLTFTYPVLWFKTVPVTNNLNGAYFWKDITGNNAKFLKYSAQGAGNGIEYQVKRDTMRSYNFNPSIYLPCENISKEILINKTNLSQTTVIGVWGSKEDFDKNNFIFAINGRRNEGIVFTKQWVAEGDASKSILKYGNDTLRSLMYNSRAPVLEGAQSNFCERSLRVGTYYRTNKPDNTLWGETQKAVISIGGKLERTNVNNTSTYPDSVYQKEAFKGYSPELLVFDRQLSALESNKFETYLAIKYGISLDKSYITPHGNVIWDYKANQGFNNRITGYGREDNLGLYQKMSTTSYEEAPFFSHQTTYDSFDGNDSYNPASRYRLLVVGYQQGNTPDNDSYVLYGDNGDTLKFVNKPTNEVNYQLKRSWLLNTKLPYSSASPPKLKWNDNTLFSVSEDKTDIVKTGSISTLSTVTQDVLRGNDGYFAWTVEQEYGSVMVKFGTNQAALVQGSHDYGYKIDSVGRVYPINRGYISPYILFNIEKGQRIEMEKNSSVIYLRINGVRYKNTEILIDTADYRKTYYGAITVGNNPFDIKLTDFRHGGFVDTGNRIELSYLRIPQLATYRNKQTYLIIDRSGSGNFGASSEVYACNEVDTVRSKIIFNNIVWNTGGSGKLFFTFGYKAPQVTQPNLIKSLDKPGIEDETLSFAELKIYYPDINDKTRITVKLLTKNPVPTTILLMDMLGRIISRLELPESKEIQYTDIRLPAPGMYVVKVFNKETNYSQKIISGK